jgi:hypothetical protein
VLAVAEQRRWDSARGEDGELTFTAPDGRALPAEPPRQMAEAVLESLHEWAADRGLDRSDSHARRRFREHEFALCIFSLTED